MLRFQCSRRRASRSSCHLSHRSINLSGILSIAITSISPLAIAALVSQLNGSTTNITSASGEICTGPRTAWRNQRVRAVLSRSTHSAVAHWVWAGDGECGVTHALIVALRRGLVAHASAKPRYLLPAISLLRDRPVPFRGFGGHSDV